MEPLGRALPNLVVIMAGVLFHPQPAPEGTSFDGVNLTPVLSGETPTTSRDLFRSSGTRSGWTESIPSGYP